MNKKTMNNMKLRRLTMGTLICLGAVLVSCHSSYDEGSSEGHYDTVQAERNDRTMSNQQHDGLEQTTLDSASKGDSGTQQMMPDSAGH